MSQTELQVENKLLVEADQLKAFIARLIAKDPKTTLTLEEALVLFKQYQVRMDRIREELRPAYEACQRGESVPFNMQEIVNEVLEEMKAKGIH